MKWENKNLTVKSVLQNDIATITQFLLILVGLDPLAP